MKFIKKFKKESIIIFISVICLTTLSLGFSYAIFFDIDTSTSNQTIQTGALQVDFGSSTTSITNNNMVPTPDAIGLESSASSTIYLQNNGSLDSNIIITIGYDYESVNSVTKLIPLEFLKAAVFEYNSSSGENTLVSDVINLGDLVANQNLEGSFNLFESVISKSSSGANTKTYTVKIWLSDLAPEYIASYQLFLKVGIDAYVSDSVTNYTINGKLNNSSDAALTNADISIQNGYIRTTTDASGNFTLNNINKGRYNIKIVDSNDFVYTGTFVVAEKAQVDLSKYLNNHMVQLGNNLEDIVYTYATSINNLKKINSIIQNSNDHELIDNTNVMIPNVYIINGGIDNTINNLTVTVANNQINNMTLQ